jgi:hypothetical protein
VSSGDSEKTLKQKAHQNAQDAVLSSIQRRVDRRAHHLHEGREVVVRRPGGEETNQSMFVQALRELERLTRPPSTYPQSRSRSR